MSIRCRKSHQIEEAGRTRAEKRVVPKQNVIYNYPNKQEAACFVIFEHGQPLKSWKESHT